MPVPNAGLLIFFQGHAPEKNFRAPRATTLRRPGEFVKGDPHNHLRARHHLLAELDIRRAVLDPLEAQDGPEGLDLHEPGPRLPVGVYLVHVLFLDLLADVFGVHAADLPALVSVPVFTLGIAFASLLVSLFLNAIPGLRGRIV